MSVTPLTPCGVRMTLKAPERAATMQPIGNDDTPDYMRLVMPLRLLS